MPDGASAGGVAHFEYLPPPWVELAFFGEGREAARGGSGATGELVCLDPALPAAGAVCCAGGPGGPPSAECRASGEYVSWAEAEARCAAAGKHLCATNHATATTGLPKRAAACGYHTSAAHRRFLVWQQPAAAPAPAAPPPPCAQRILVDPAGRVAVVHRVSQPARTLLRFLPGDGGEAGGGFFRVRWDGGRHPGEGPSACAAAGCEWDAGAAAGRWCECAVAVRGAAVFGSPGGQLPGSRREAEDALRIGVHRGGRLERCRTAECDRAERDAELQIWVPPGGTAVDGRAVFVLRLNGTQSERAFANRASVVEAGAARNGSVGSVGSVRFRNPPHFLSTTTSPDTHAGGDRPVEAELDAMLQGLVLHPNTAPFVAGHLARQMVTSNPSPRYVGAIARAFRTGRVTWAPRWPPRCSTARPPRPR